MSNAENKSIECPYCHYHFPDRQDTWDKVRINNGKVRCKECGNTFEVSVEPPKIQQKENIPSQSSVAEENVEPVVQEDNTKTITCPKCGYTYSARPDMWEKIKAVNGKLRCAKCKTTFQVPLDEVPKEENSDYGIPFADENESLVQSNSNEPGERRCPFCSELISTTASKCRHCGEWLLRKCPYCKETIPADAQKCKNCGEWIDNGSGSNPTKSNKSLYEYSGWWLRFGALLIDSLILAVPGAFLQFLHPFYYYRIEDIVIPSTLSTLLWWIYSAGLESSSMQATVGKAALDLIVADTNGNRLSFGRATGRYFAKLISSLTLGVGYIIILFTRKRQCLHDIIADTLVLKKVSVVDVGK